MSNRLRLVLYPIESSEGSLSFRSKSDFMIRLFGYNCFLIGYTAGMAAFTFPLEAWDLWLASMMFASMAVGFTLTGVRVLGSRALLTLDRNEGNWNAVLRNHLSLESSHSGEFDQVRSLTYVSYKTFTLNRPRVALEIEFATLKPLLLTIEAPDERYLAELKLMGKTVSAITGVPLTNNVAWQAA